MENLTQIRKKKKYVCPNPLFLKWLTEWQREAAEKGLKLQYTYAKALSSLKKYPLPLNSGKEAINLEHFGDKICSMLDAKLLEHKQSTRQPSSSLSTNEPSSSVISSSSFKSTSLTKKSPRKTTSTMKIKTVESSLVQKVHPSFGNPPIISTPDISSLLQQPGCFKLFPGQFKILLCVDNCETLSGHGKTKKQFLSEFQKSGVEFEMRKLHVGDFLWVAQDMTNTNRELVLDFVVERKRLDDLAHSIKDGRFKEQKFRMKKSGVRNPVYLVENCGGAKYLGIPEMTLEQAMINTQIIDGFLVRKTQGVKDSVNYLSHMTKILRTKFQHQTLISGTREFVHKNNAESNVFLTFQEFNAQSVKNKSLTVKEMFAKHLLQIFGLSVDRAAAIVELYQTPFLFLEAYDSCSSDNERLQMISMIKYGVHKKNIGPALSKSLLQYYGEGYPR